MIIALKTDPAQLLQGGMFALARGTLINPNRVPICETVLGFLSPQDRDEYHAREQRRSRLIRWANVQLAEARFAKGHGGKKP